MYAFVRYTRPRLVKNRIQSCVVVTKKCSTTSSRCGVAPHTAAYRGAGTGTAWSPCAWRTRLGDAHHHLTHRDQIPSLPRSSAGMKRERRSSRDPTISPSSSPRSGAAGPVGEDVHVVGDHPLEFGSLVDDLLSLQGREPTQLHVQDRCGLDLVDVEQFHQPGTGVLDRRPTADQCDHLVEGIESLEVPAQDVCRLGLAQPVGGTALDDLDLVVDPVA